MQSQRRLFSNKRIAFCALALLAAAQASSSTADAKNVGKAQTAPNDPTLRRPLSASELRRIYSGKTWLWESGGGYMDASGRFDAVSDNSQGRASLIGGRWSANDKGRLCFAGIWRTQRGRAHAETCFTHQARGEAIYQRKEPKGSWYEFKRSPATESDEINKVVEGNRIAAQFPSRKTAQASDQQKRK